MGEVFLAPESVLELEFLPSVLGRYGEDARGERVHDEAHAVARGLVEGHHPEHLGLPRRW